MREASVWIKTTFTFYLYLLPRCVEGFTGSQCDQPEQGYASEQSDELSILEIVQWTLLSLAVAGGILAASLSLTAYLKMSRLKMVTCFEIWLEI